MTRLEGFLQKVKNHSVWFTFFIFVYSILLLLSIHGFSIELGDPDGFYHARVSALMVESLVIDFPYLAGTDLDATYADHAFLYHVFLIPFVLVMPPLWGAFIGTLILSATALTVLMHWVRYYDRDKIFCYLFLLTVSFPFLFRLSLIKTTGISLILMLLFVHALFNNRLLLLGLLSAVYVLTHGSFPIVFVLVGCLLCAEMIYSRRFTRTIRKFIPVISIVMLGVFAGVLLHPYFPENVHFFVTQIYEIAVTGLGETIAVGAEWYPFTFIDFLGTSFFVFTPWFFALVFALVQRKKLTRDQLFFFGMALFFGILAVTKSRRHIEYFIPFALLSLATLLVEVRFKVIIGFVKDLFYTTSRFQKILRWYVVGFVVIFACVSMWSLTRSLNGITFDFSQSEMRWLQDNSDKGSIVINAEWDEFPQMFYYNQYNYFVVGLDAAFMYKKNTNVYWLWRGVIDASDVGVICEMSGYCFERRSDAFRMLQRELNASYFVMNKHRRPELLEDIDHTIVQDAGMEKIHEGDNLIIYSFDQI